MLLVSETAHYLTYHTLKIIIYKILIKIGTFFLLPKVVRKISIFENTGYELISVLTSTKSPQKVALRACSRHDILERSNECHWCQQLRTTLHIIHWLILFSDFCFLFVLSGKNLLFSDKMEKQKSTPSNHIFR